MKRLLDVADRVSKNFAAEKECPACNKNAREEWHHIVPTHLGGPVDGPLIHICSICHNKVHKAATQLSKNKETIPLNPIQGVLARIIVKAMFVEQIRPEEIPRNIAFRVPDAVLKKMHKRKLDLGYSNLTDYMIGLINRDIARL